MDGKEFFEMKMEMMKKREEMLNAMGDKELRAFIKGYMMAERMVFKRMIELKECDCNCGSDGCGGDSCGCGEKECDCGKE